MAIVVHHLNNSRSQRIVWLLEELGLEYSIQHYQRDAVTNLAPPELKKIHPLGKSPLLEVDGELIQESGAIAQYLCERYGQGRFLPAPGSRESLLHLQWMHFAEGSVMTPVLLRLYVNRLGDAGKPLHPRIDEQLTSYFDYMESQLRPSGHYVGDDWSAADVMLSFPAELATMQPEAARWPKLKDFVDRIHARPAWQKAYALTGGYF
jgi:glutathione S-transferase